MNFIKLDVIFDCASLEKKLTASNAWDLYPQRRTFPGSPHHKMVDIWARFGDVSKGDFSILGKEHDAVWYPCVDHLPEVKDIAFALMAAVRGERLGGILITKLPPGGTIDQHIDSGWHAGYYEKFYVAVKNHPGSEFCFNDGCIRAEQGEAYWFRNDVLHWVNNNTDHERIAMIVCIKTDMFEEFK